MNNLLKRSKYARMVTIENKKYLFSNISGFIAEIDDFQKAEFLSKTTVIEKKGFDENSLFTPDEKELLVEAGIYVSGGVDEDILFRDRIEEFRSKKELDIILMLTEDCNFRCVYCYEHHLQTYMAISEVDTIIERIRLLIAKYAIKKLRVAYFGGEPLLNKNVMKYAHQRFEHELGKYDVDYLLITNGYLLSKEIVDFLFSYKSDISLQVTLDGPPTMHNARRKLTDGGATFNRILRNIEYASMYLPLIIRINMDKESHRHIRELLAILKEAKLNVDNIYISPNVASTNTQFNREYQNHCLEDNISTLGIVSLARMSVMQYGFKLDQKSIHYEHPVQYGDFPFGVPKFLFCAAYSGKHLVFMPGGNIFTCMERVSDSQFAVGNIYNSCLFNDNYKKWIGFSIANYEKCKLCPISCFCGGNCGSLSISHYGDLCEPMCPAQRELIQNNNIIF